MLSPGQHHPHHHRDHQATRATPPPRQRLPSHSPPHSVPWREHLPQSGSWRRHVCAVSVVLPSPGGLCEGNSQYSVIFLISTGQFQSILNQNNKNLMRAEDQYNSLLNYWRCSLLLLTDFIAYFVDSWDDAVPLYQTRAESWINFPGFGWEILFWWSPISC